MRWWSRFDFSVFKKLGGHFHDSGVGGDEGVVGVEDVKFIHAFDSAAFDRYDTVVFRIEQGAEKGNGAAFAHNDSGVGFFGEGRGIDFSHAELLPGGAEGVFERAALVEPLDDFASLVRWREHDDAAGLLLGEFGEELAGDDAT